MNESTSIPIYAAYILLTCVISVLRLTGCAPALHSGCARDLTVSRDHDQVSDPSMLRFLVDLRGEDATDSQLRDDLMTMLIAGHETTAAVLTWAFFEMAQHPEVVRKAQEEVDRVIGDKVPTLDDIK